MDSGAAWAEPKKHLPEGLQDPDRAGGYMKSARQTRDDGVSVDGDGAASVASGSQQSASEAGDALDAASSAAGEDDGEELAADWR